MAKQKNVADMHPSEMLGEAMAVRNILAKADLSSFAEMDARMQVIQADALISIADSLARIARALEVANHA